ncbi:YcnI family protein [uncultured Tateyamaria sp.]|uniref:YcnI family copper-binding membrane protein n=1 Tax=uncultured Tateyamaria sp. TaxID=455651 RepID=UPI00261EFC51|nr:YcnI family protein [uncultured Tateyamaria sp.]
MKPIVISTALALGATGALAHATLETQSAVAGSTYKGVMRIGHGCDGEATLRVDIHIPEGVIAVKPMPKPGWTLTSTTGTYDQSYDHYGDTLTEGVKTLTWEGSLDDAHYDEFTFRAKLAGDWSEGDMVFFPTLQTCANGTAEWMTIPAAGQDPHDLNGPAPGLKIKTDHSAHDH